MQQMKECAFCQTSPAFNVCSGCRSAWYCNSSCQASHWMVHEKMCKLTQAKAPTPQTEEGAPMKSTSVSLVSAVAGKVTKAISHGPEETLAKQFAALSDKRIEQKKAGGGEVKYKAELTMPVSYAMDKPNGKELLEKIGELLSNGQGVGYRTCRQKKGLFHMPKSVTGAMNYDQAMTKGELSKILTCLDDEKDVEVLAGYITYLITDHAKTIGNLEEFGQALLDTIKNQ
jgi:hypothetical protein